MPCTHHTTLSVVKRNPTKSKSHTDRWVMLPYFRVISAVIFNLMADGQFGLYLYVMTSDPKRHLLLYLVVLSYVAVVVVQK